MWLRNALKYMNGIFAGCSLQRQFILIVILSDSEGSSAMEKHAFTVYWRRFFTAL